MISSIFVDFCELKETQNNLVELIVIHYFSQDIIDLSSDRVPNVRISLAEAFYTLHKKLDQLEIMESDSDVS